MKNISIIIASLVIFTFLIQPILFKKFDIKPGGKQEKYSMLFQQTARYVKEHPKDVTKEEEDILRRVFNYDTLSESYNPINADLVKGYSQKGKDEDYIKYIKVWLKQGFKHPGSYIKATGAMLSGSFSLSKYKPLMDMSWHDQLNSSVIDEDSTIRIEGFKKTSEFISSLYDKLFIGKIFSYGFWVTLAPAFICITLIKYRKNSEKIKVLLVVVPLVLSIILGVWLAPVSASYGEGMRYVYPIIYTIPITILWCFYSIKKSS